MKEARGEIQFQIFYESYEKVLSLLSKKHTEKIIVIFPIKINCEIHISVFINKEASVNIKRTLSEQPSTEYLYLLQIDNTNIILNHNLLELYVNGEVFVKIEAEDIKLTVQIFKKLYNAELKKEGRMLAQLYIKIFFQHLFQVLSRLESFDLREEVLAKQFIRLLHSKKIPLHYVKDYAEQLFVSRRYLTAAVHKALGRTPKSIIDNILVEKAREMLRTKIMIYNAAEELGFESHASFTSFFKKHTGLTPSEYRLNKNQKK